MLCLPPFTFLTTRTGFPALQSLASAPFLSLMGALQFRARALQEKVRSTSCIYQAELFRIRGRTEQSKVHTVNQFLRSNKLHYFSQSSPLVQLSTILRVAVYWHCAEPQQLLPRKWTLLPLCRYRRGPF